MPGYTGNDCETGNVIYLWTNKIVEFTLYSIVVTCIKLYINVMHLPYDFKILMTVNRIPVNMEEPALMELILIFAPVLQGTPDTNVKLVELPS